MPAYKDELRNTWYASFYYSDWQGKRRLKKKRGFQRKKDAQAFGEEFLRTRARSCDMTFRSFAEIYLGGHGAAPQADHHAEQAIPYRAPGPPVL